MKSAPPRILLLLAALLGLNLSALSAEFFVRDGDRVVFLGDSITEQRLYTTYIEAYALTRHPEWKLSFRNVGWGGDTAWLRQRTHPDEKQLFAATGADLDKMVQDSVGRGLARDVLPLNPSVVTVKFGMNDHSYQAFRPDIFRAYVRSQEEIARVLSSHQARVAFLTPQPIEDKRPDPDKDARNQSLRRFSDGLKEVAAREHATFIDQFDPYMAIMLHARETDPAALIGGGDAVHPGPIGHTIMAWAVLKGLGATPLVSRAEVDLATKKATGENCTVENLKVAAGAISFDRTDSALPMPIDRRADPALKLAPILDELNRYELCVRGDLAQGNYQILIDGETAAKASAQDLAKGVNLAVQAGPITKQSLDLLDLVFKKNNTYFNRWRGVQLYEFPNWAQSTGSEALRQAELKRLDQQIQETEDQINQLRKPVKHHFEIKRAD